MAETRLKIYPLIAEETLHMTIDFFVRRTIIYLYVHFILQRLKRLSQCLMDVGSVEIVSKGRFTMRTNFSPVTCRVKITLVGYSSV